MECDLCKEKIAIYDYLLNDNSRARICEECGKIVYGVKVNPVIPNNRLFHLIALKEYISF